MALNNPSQGEVISVAAALPLISSGGPTPEISFDSSTPNGVYSLNVSGGTFTLVETVGETVGSIKTFATTTIPTNYLWCNGATVLIATYPDLFAAIGITYGGDGVTNFNLPNLTDRFIKGDNGSNIGTQTGSNNLTENQLPIVTPTGTIEVSTNQGDITAQTDAWISGSGATDGGENVLLFVEDGLQGSTISVSGFNANSFGNNEEHEHPNLTLRYAICFESVGVSTASPTPSFSQTLAVNNNSNIRAQFNGVNYLTENEVIDYVFENGISIDIDTVELGGSLTKNTVIDGDYLFDIKSTLLDYGAAPNLEVGFKIGEDVNGGEIGTSLYCFNPISFATAEFLVSVNDNAAYSLTTDGTANSYNRIVNNPNEIVLSSKEVGGNKAFTLTTGGATTYNDVDGTGIQYNLTDYNSLTADSLVPKSVVQNLITSGNIIEQTHVAGPSVIVNDTTTILYVDPASAIASLTVILPENPINGQEVKVSFGGTISLGVVCTALAITGNTGHTVLGGVGITDADVGDGYIFKFQSSTNLWRIF